MAPTANTAPSGNSSGSRGGLADSVSFLHLDRDADDSFDHALPESEDSFLLRSEVGLGYHVTHCDVTKTRKKNVDGEERTEGYET